MKFKTPTEDDLMNLYGEDPPDDFIKTDLPSHIIWDNGAYVQMHIFIEPGEWFSVDTEETWKQIPQVSKDEYIKMTGDDFPVAGQRMKSLFFNQKSQRLKNLTSN